MLACISGDSAVGASVVRHARAVARGLHLEVTVGRVFETSRHLDAPADPLEWQMHRSECRRELERIAATDGEAPRDLDSVLLAGPPAEELGEWARSHGVTLIAMATHERRRRSGNSLGSTAKAILDEAGASLLLVPPGQPGMAEVAYRRLLVPLDGSLRAESVIPVAVRIARAHGAELILAHVVPRLDLGDDFLAARSRDLYSHLEDRNERRAREYLEELRVRLWREQLPTRSIVVPHGDPRVLLRRLAVEQHVDLIVLSSHGRSGMSDVPCGSVTEYLATHAPAPMLIVRPNFAHGFARSDVRADERIVRPVIEPAG